ncbi:MAG: DNA polymerase III subunit chi [Pseudomonadota bacterium]
MKVDFWQLSRDPVEKVVALIAQRVMDQGERLLVVSSNPEQREAISQGLWRAGPESFLAHGDASDPQPEAQPILLSEAPEPANKASHVIYADGTYREAGGFERTFLLFDEATVDQARAVWRSLDGADIERAFFRQDGGKWVKVA